jgi:short-subunit dehydrogenase
MQVILITGASEGIGAEMARQLAAQHGASVYLVLAARQQPRLEAVAAQCQAHGSQTLVVPGDLAVRSQCEQLIATTMAQCGRLDILINNAGVSAHALLADVQTAHLAWYEDLMRINFWASVWCTHAALPHLQASRGQVVAVSSLAGLVGVPGRTAYCASKFAMAGFFEALRTELRDTGVGVTIAYPGVVSTQIRHRGWNAQGQCAGVSGLKENKAMSVATCARLILQGMARRPREVVMSTQGKWARLFKLIAPGWVEKRALAALKEEAKPC